MSALPNITDPLPSDWHDKGMASGFVLGAEWHAAQQPSREQSPAYRPAARCELCGRFARTVRLVYTGAPVPEPDYEVGECCEHKVNRAGS